MLPKLRLLFVSMIFAAVFGLAMSAKAEEREVSICYTPWGAYGGKDLPGKGIIPDFTTRVLQHAGYKVKVDIVPWPRCVEGTKKHKYDLIASAWRGKNFDPYFDYFDITWENDINFIVAKDSDIVSGEIENFFGKTVAHVRDSGGMDAIRNHPSIKTQEVAVMDKMVKMVLAKRFDAILSDPPSLLIAASKMKPALHTQLRVLDPPLLTNYNSPLIAKNHPRKEELRRGFNKALKETVSAGLYDEMIRIHGEEIRYDVPREYRK